MQLFRLDRSPALFWECRADRNGDLLILTGIVGRTATVIRQPLSGDAEAQAVATRLAESAMASGFKPASDLNVISLRMRHQMFMWRWLAERGLKTEVLTPVAFNGRKIDDFPRAG
ncbi:hypothetical protein [Tropicimonas marinistellae]|uniref:hypothetical protein n=1 Tax=Tropicimonas marinistellae TaxID=1739787 RepID=UPI000837364A|nr:hypothetical protein [Tropicimonas marinistellae]